MTAQEILERLPQIFENSSIEDFAYGDFDQNEIPENIGEILEVEQYGGEGKGDEWYSIKHFTKHDVYICVSGRYSSEWGTSFGDGWGYEVKPVQKMVTSYEAV